MMRRLLARFQTPLPPHKDPTSLGFVLVDLGFLTGAELTHVLQRKANMSDDEMLGEMLVAAGKLTRLQLAHALIKQRERRGVRVDYRAESRFVLDMVSRAARGLTAPLDELAKAVEAASAPLRETSTKRSG